MHDTFLNENIYEAVTELCKEHDIKRVNSITVSVHQNSHISGHSLRELFSEKGSGLIDERTSVVIEKDQPEPLTAEIREIDGVSRDED